MKLTEIAFKQNRLFIFILVTLVLGGVGAYTLMSKLEDPEIKIKVALIITPYPGASTEEVELSVTDMLEAEIKAMGDVDKIRSRSMPNMSEIEVTLRNSIPDAEITQYWDILRKKVSDASSMLPQGAMTPIVVDDFGDVFGLFYAMTADGYSDEEMNDYADELKKRLLTIDGVRRVNLNGKQTPAIFIDIDQDKLTHLGLHPLQLITAIRNQNSVVYAGHFETTDREVRIGVQSQTNSTEEISNIIIHANDDAQVRLGDIAQIRRGAQKPASTLMKYNMQPAIGISVSMETGENIVTIGERVAQLVASFEKELPAGIRFEKVYFQSDEVNNAINNFTINLISSLLIVIVVIMLVMGFRGGAIIGVSLLLTIVGTFPFLYLLDGTIQRVSLASFIIAMGMLVDNGIVVVDGMWEDLKKGTFRRKAMFRIPKRTAWPLLGATLIAIFSFLPVYLSPDNTGTYTRDLFLVLAISLLLSWFLAMTQVPLMAYYLLNPKGKKDNQKSPKKTKNRFQERMRALIEWSLIHKTVVIVSVILLLGSTLWSFRYVRHSFFPEFTYKQAYLEYKLPYGTSIEKVEADLDEITQWLRQKEEVMTVTSSVGETPTRYNLTRLIAERSSSYGELIIEFEDYESRVALKPVIEDYVHSHYPDAYARMKNYSIIFSENLVEAEFTGPDPEVLKRLAQQAEGIMRQSLWVDEATVRNSWQPLSPYLHVDYKTADGKRASIERMDIGLSLLTATSGFPVSDYQEGTKTLPVMLQMTQNNGDDIDDLQNIPIWGLNSIDIPIQKILNREIPLDQLEDELLRSQPLSSVAALKLKWEEPLVRRLDSKRAIKAQCDPAEGFTATDVLTSIQEDIENMQLPQGYTLNWQGEKGDQKEALKYIVMYLPVALFLIVLMLLALFKSYRKTLIMFIGLLLAVIGIVPALIVTGAEFGFLAIVGAIGLMGMMIKNGVVLIDEIDRLLKETGDLHKSLVDASLSRVRPVLMASLTTVLGMFPLIFDPFFNSMAVTIMGGLLVGTLIVIIVVPVLYLLFFKIYRVTA